MIEESDTTETTRWPCHDGLCSRMRRKYGISKGLTLIVFTDVFPGCHEDILGGRSEVAQREVVLGFALIPKGIVRRHGLFAKLRLARCLQHANTSIVSTHSWLSGSFATERIDSSAF